MKYLVMELQTAADGSVANLVYSFDTRDEADSKYHYILSYAAVSTLPAYAAMVFTSTGELLMSQYYAHNQEPEPSPEPEPEPNE